MGRRQNVSIDKCSGPSCICHKAKIVYIKLSDIDGPLNTIQFSGPPPIPPLIAATLAVRQQRDAIRLRQRWLQ